MTAPAPTLDSAQPDPVFSGPQENRVIAAIVRWRWWIFLFVALLLVAGHNGRWRIGRDSALYRAVGHNLAIGRGYTFRGEVERQIYPGLPRLLESVERLTGPEDLFRPHVSLLVMLALCGLTLVVIYRLVRVYFPTWVAVCVTAGAGINYEFHQAAHDIMTDMPFLLGVCLTLLGFARAGEASMLRGRVWGVALLLVGAMIAVSTRVTFWALAAAWLATCAVGIVRSRRRWWYLGGLVLLSMVCVAWLLFDPRSAGRLTSSRSYELSVLTHLIKGNFHRWLDRLVVTLEEHLSYGIFGIELNWGLGTGLTLLLAAAALVLMKKSVLWGMYVWAVLAMLLLVGSVPRYYLMALPLLLLEWVLISHWLSLQARRWRLGPEIAFCAAICPIVIAPLIRSTNLVMEQHGITRKFEKKDFLDVYWRGDSRRLVRLAELIRKNTPRNARIIGPEARILTLLSNRDVFHPSDLRVTDRARWKRTLAKGRFSYYIHGKSFANDSYLRRLPRRKLVVLQRPPVARLGDVSLSKIVQNPAGVQSAKSSEPAKSGRAGGKPRAKSASSPATRPAIRHSLTPATRPGTRPSSRPARPVRILDRPATRPARLG